MAIQDNFNISQALSNESYAWKCWYNYNYENNTMGISSSAMGQIVTQYRGSLKHWKAIATSDENKYEISDADFNKAVDKGYKDTADKAGYEGGGKGKMIGNGVLRGGIALAGIAANTIARDAVSNGVKSVIGKDALKTGMTSKSGGTDHNGAWIVTAPLALATGMLYKNSRPNKAQYEAAIQLRDSLLPEAQARAADAQVEMDEADSEVLELTEEAEELNEDTNEDIKEDKAEFDIYKESYEALIAKIESGEPLTDEEKELLKQLVPLMQQLGEDISTLNEDTIEYIQDLYADIEEYQEYYDDAADIIATVQGVIDYGESFLHTAQTMMYVEAGAQTLNVISAGRAGIDAGRYALAAAWVDPLKYYAIACVGMAAVGAYLSGAGAAEQFQWARDTGGVIDLNAATQDLNDATSDIYDERLSDYEGYMQIVGDLEIEIPEDTEAPEEVPEVPEGTEGTEGAEGSSGTPKEEETDPKKKDIGKSDDYSAVMGYGSDYTHIIQGDMPLEQGVVLVNDKNKVVMSQSYAEAISKATGDKSGRRYSTNLIPKIIANLLPAPFDEKTVRGVMNGKKLDSEHAAKLVNAVSGEETGTTTVNNTNKATNMAKQVINFYSAIFKSAATRGWTTGVEADLENLKKVNVG